MTSPARRLLAEGRVSPDGAVARIAAREAAVEMERVARVRRDRKNAQRRARRAAGKGVRAAGATAPPVVEPVAAPEPADGLRFCDLCRERVTAWEWAQHHGLLGGRLWEMDDADHERSDRVARERRGSWPW